ncbi:MAG TPA: OmpH family outer membrane protein [Steroidobacteraceae bacterium]|nr:OmpH family outer membrane protein [Steroidobacteraceae bacterium]
MSTFTRSIPLLALCLCGLAVAQGASAQTKIGVVNFQQLLQEAPQTKTAMRSLQKEFAPRQRALLAMQSDLKAKNANLEKNGQMMADAERIKAESALRDEQSDFQAKAHSFQDDVSAQRNEELGKVQHFLLAQIQDYARSKGLDIVFGDGVFFAKESYDITPGVLALLMTKPATLPEAPAGAKKRGGPQH